MVGAFAIYQPSQTLSHRWEGKFLRRSPILPIASGDVIRSQAMVGHCEYIIHKLKMVHVNQTVPHHQIVRFVIERIQELLMVVNVILITHKSRIT